MKFAHPLSAPAVLFLNACSTMAAPVVSESRVEEKEMDEANKPMTGIVSKADVSGRDSPAFTMAAITSSVSAPLAARQEEDQMVPQPQEEQMYPHPEHEYDPDEDDSDSNSDDDDDDDEEQQAISARDHLAARQEQEPQVQVVEVVKQAQEPEQASADDSDSDSDDLQQQFQEQMMEQVEQQVEQTKQPVQPMPTSTSVSNDHQFAELIQQSNDQIDEIDDQEMEIREKSREIEALDDELDQQDDVIDEQKQVIREHEKEIEEDEQELENQDKVIKDQDKEIDILDAPEPQPKIEVHEVLPNGELGKVVESSAIPVWQDPSSSEPLSDSDSDVDLHHVVRRSRFQSRRTHRVDVQANEQVKEQVQKQKQDSPVVGGEKLQRRHWHMNPRGRCNHQ